jgi:ferritin-like protein
MGQNSNTLHEDPEVLGPEVIDRHRAIASLMEELEAVDWYDQRVQACQDEELKKILAHNRDEEKEHAMMVLEWLRRHDPKLDEHMRTYLFSEGSITNREHEVEHGGGAGGKAGGGGGEGPSPSGSLNVGSLRGKELK